SEELAAPVRGHARALRPDPRRLPAARDLRPGLPAALRAGRHAARLHPRPRPLRLRQLRPRADRSHGLRPRVGTRDLRPRARRALAAAAATDAAILREAAAVTAQLIAAVTSGPVHSLGLLERTRVDSPAGVR